MPEAELWFLPGPSEEEEAPAPLTEVALWAEAEGLLAARLARAAMRLGALDERLKGLGAGARQRLALAEAGTLAWASGTRISHDRLALWLVLRARAVGADAPALERAAWAVRRLAGGPGPEVGLADFLGRPPETLAAWQAALEGAGPLHPVSRACLGFHLWPWAGIGTDSGADSTGAGLEAAVVAARLAAAEGQGGLSFAPLSANAGAALRPGGPPAARLARWLAGIEAGALAQLRDLEALADWRARAEAATGRLKGRVPGLLVASLEGWPLLSAPMAERLTGASRAAAQRGLVWLEGQGLAREVTGQGRFRFWQAMV